MLFRFGVLLFKRFIQIDKRPAQRFGQGNAQCGLAATHVSDKKNLFFHPRGLKQFHLSGFVIGFVYWRRRGIVGFFNFLWIGDEWLQFVHLFEIPG